MLIARHVSLRQRWTGAQGGRALLGRAQPAQWRHEPGRGVSTGTTAGFSSPTRAKLDDAPHDSHSTSTHSSSGSRRRKHVKKVSHTPLILDALAQHGLGSGWHPSATGKVDFQYISPFQHALSRPSGTEIRPRSRETWRKTRLASPNLSHKSILATYLRLLFGEDLQTQTPTQEASSTRQIQAVFHEDAIECLKSTGFQPVDVVRWSWILCAESSFQAAARLHAISNRPLEEGEAATPMFLLQLILLRPTVSARAIRLLLVHSFDRLSNISADDWTSDLLRQGMGIQDRLAGHSVPSATVTVTELGDRRPYPGASETAIITLTIRLLRHARKVWPKGLPYVARLFTRHVTGQVNYKPIGHSQLSFVYNKMLHLLSLPSENFFTQIKHHQEAQLTIVRAMSEFEPPLLVDRLGYRSVASVQLAHRKTSAEARWAARKAESWPPWQEHRSGLDENVGIEAGTTRAGLALSQLSESGYSTTTWEDAAGVISGWDTDKSPTIQTRSVFPATPMRKLDLKNEEADELVWSARIRATRTVEEAWAIFLMCQDASCDREETFVAIAEKLLAESKSIPAADSAARRDETDAYAPLPGDNPEPFEASPNPRKRPYLRSPVPTPDRLLDISESRGVKPGVRLITCMLERSCTHERGKRLVEFCSLPRETKDMILGLKEPETSWLRYVDNRLLLAILRWCTTEFNPEAITMLGNSSSWIDTQAQIDKHATQVMTAFRLVSATQTTYSPAWTPLFRALTPPGQKRRFLLLSQRGLLKMVQLLAEMEQLEIERTWGQFACLCRTFSLARIAILGRDATNTTEDEYRTMHQVRTISTSLLKSEFGKLAGTNFAYSNHTYPERRENISETEDEPTRTPSPAEPLREPKAHELYIFIQALGLARDYEGIVAVARWLQLHWSSLGQRPDYSITGRKLHRCFIAMRTFLEDNWTLSPHDRSTGDVPAEELCDVARGIICAIGGEQAWPSDEEVAAYQPLALAALWPHL